MFIELVDSLRCPRPHEDTWLVAAVARFHGRHVADGSLGCPVCRAQYPVRDGGVDFTAGGRGERASQGVDTPGEDEVLRARALLGLAEPGGTVALVGEAASLAPALEEAAQVTLLLVNPRRSALGPGTSTVWVDDGVPLAAGVLRGAMIGAGVDASRAFVDSLVRALAPRARLVAPAARPVPDGMTELARDAREWVAERAAERVSPPVPLRRPGR